MKMEDVWTIMSDYLYFISHAYNFRIHAFVLMQNHYHLLGSAPLGYLSPAMQYFLAQTSRQITKCAGRINHTWRARFFRCEIQTEHYYMHAYKYFYRNPVEAGVCERVEDYQFSTIPGLLGQRKLIIPVHSDDTLFSDISGTLDWLNTPTNPDYRDVIRRALRRSKFKLPRDKNGKLHPLEGIAY